MPREIVRIDLSSKFPIEVGARFFSIIAYPEAKDAIARHQFSLAISRMYIEWRAMVDPEFVGKLHYVVPEILLARFPEAKRTFKRGNKRLRHHFTAASRIALPQFKGNRLKPILLQTKDGQLQSLIPTVKNMATLAMGDLGWLGKATSLPTFKSKIWATSRPIVHAASAYCLWCEYVERALPAESQLDTYFFLTLEYPPSIEWILRQAEQFRQMLPSIDLFDIKDEDTVQFLWEGSPAMSAVTE
jgi:hypothetical protein